jgi:hypothetical protein
LRAYAKVKVVSPRGKMRFSESINVVRPRSVRLDTLGLFGRVFSILATDGKDLFFVSPGERRMYAGEPAAGNLARFLPFSLDLEDIVAVLLGGLPEPAAPPSIRYDPVHGTLVIRTQNRSGSVSLATLDAGSLDLTRLQIIDPPPRLAAVVEYDSWNPVGGISFPTGLSIRVPSRDVLMQIRFKKLEPNAEIDGNLFAITPPDGFEIVPMNLLPPPPDHNLAPGLEPTPVEEPDGSAAQESE